MRRGIVAYVALIGIAAVILGAATLLHFPLLPRRAQRKSELIIQFQMMSVESAKRRTEYTVRDHLAQRTIAVDDMTRSCVDQRYPPTFALDDVRRRLAAFERTL